MMTQFYPAKDINAILDFCRGWNRELMYEKIRSGDLVDARRYASIGATLEKIEDAIRELQVKEVDV